MKYGVITQTANQQPEQSGFLLFFVNYLFVVVPRCSLSGSAYFTRTES
nr:MAG TPA: hypothetical protein [Caudoviricetes sp.]